MSRATTDHEWAWFLFTDVEDSTRLWDHDAAGMVAALAQHDALLADAVESNGGKIVKHTGDGVLAYFDRADTAVKASVAAQVRFEAEPWASLEPLRVRIGLHGSECDDENDAWYRRGEDFVGPALHRCARVMGAGHGGQVLCTRPVVEHASGREDDTVRFIDLGGHHLRGLSQIEQIFQVTHPELQADFPQLRSLSTVPGRLPATLDEFVGRELEADEVAGLVRRHRVVTLTGVGGVGKTRLSIEVAGSLAAEFPDGVWFVPLAPVTEPDLVAGAVARALGIRERVGESLNETVAHALAQQRSLVVLDNCEHLLEAVALLVGSVVGTGGATRLLATSRERLDVPGERAWPVPALDVPDPDQSRSEAESTAAMQLLVGRARVVASGFEVDDDNFDALVELCRRLDGIPLALELAASRFDALSPSDVARRLDDRLRLLTRRAVESRHATLREAIGWSYDLLDDAERAVFRRLSQFSGGFTIDAAQVVTAGAGVEPADVAGIVARLVQKSLVQAESLGNRSRYRLLDTLREFGCEQIREAGELDAVQNAHRDWFVALVDGVAEDIRGPAQSAVYGQILDEIDNIRAAFEVLVARGAGEDALRMVRVLRTFWAEHFASEGVQRALAAVAAAPESPAAARAGGLADVSWIGYVSGREDSARYAEQSIALSRQAGVDPDPEALISLGMAALFDGEPATALTHFETGAKVARNQDDSFEVAACLTGSCLVRAVIGDADAAIADGEEALAIGRSLGYDTQIAAALGVLGFATGMTDPHRALELLDESLAVKADTTYSTAVQVVAGHLRLVVGDVGEAKGHFDAALRFYRDVGDPFFVPTALEGMAHAVALEGHPDKGARLLGVAERARKKLDLPGLEIERLLRALAEAAVGDGYAAEREVGRKLGLDEGLAQALDDRP